MGEQRIESVRSALVARCAGVGSSAVRRALERRAGSGNWVLPTLLRLAFRFRNNMFAWRAIPKSTSRIFVVAMLVLIQQFAASEAHAQPTQSDKDDARKLGRSGLEKLQTNDFQGALDDCRKAHEIVGAPTTGLCVARAQIGLGQMLEGKSTLAEIQRYERTPNEHEAFQKAREQASNLSALLSSMTPQVTLIIDGFIPTDLQLTFDGTPVSADELGRPREVNPGTYSVVAWATDFERVTTEISLREGDRKEERIVLRPTTMAALAPPETQALPPFPVLTPLETSISAHIIAGLTIGAFGLAALIAGATTGGLALDRESIVDDHCDANARCDEVGFQAAEEGRAFATASIITFIVSGIGVAAGLTVILTDSSGDEHARVALHCGSDGEGGLTLRHRW